MKVHIEKFVTGPIETNTYVVSSESDTALIVDPSSGCKQVIDYCRKKNLKPEAIVITHGHFDHLLGIPEIQTAFPDLAVWIHPEDKPLLTHAGYNGSNMIGIAYSYKGKVKEYGEGDTTVGGIDFKILHVPGHSPGGCALLFDGECITGDSLFAGSIGRSDLPGGDPEILINTIRGKLLTLPDETVIYPGHGGRSTIGREKRMNPFLIAD
jgi:hydroxyacylglutathione hydrolase